MARLLDWELKPETYTVKNCRHRMAEMIACENWTDMKRGRPQFKPRHSWSCGADKLFFESKQHVLAYGPRD